MTVNDMLQQVPGQPAKAKPSKSVATATDVILTVAWWAFVAGAVGLALGRGFGISVPFVPAFILAFTFGAVVKGLAQTTGSAWHAERVKADINLISASLAVQQSMRPPAGDLTGLLDSLGLSKPPADSDNSGYL